MEGINFFGSSDTEDGIGRAAALNIECLRAAGLDLDSYVLSRPVARQTGRNTLINDGLLSALQNKVNVFHFSARWVPHYFSHLGEGSLSGFYNIGYWVCEAPKIPDQWARQLEYFDEIWTASTFCQSAIARSSNIPVIRIPHPIESRDTSLRIQSRQKGVRIGAFTFLTIFNAYSDSERKNVLFTIRAFLDAHGDKPDVRLLVKVSNLEHDHILSEKLAAISQNFHNVEIIDGYIESAEVQALYERADAYVSLHRAEGFGFTISDAMGRGIPVITTGYSGNMEFCRADDTRLVAYQLRPIGHDRLRYRKEDIWAEPDMQDATAAFRELVIDYPIWISKAARARERVSQLFSVNEVAQLMLERIKLIQSNFSYHNDMGKRDLDGMVGIYETYGF
jgi:glycosyltransferase involved in cell wall biosynthesis